MSNRETPVLLPSVRNEYLTLSRKSRRIPFWLPIACFASFLLHIPLFIAVGGGLALTWLRSEDLKRLDRFYQDQIVPACLRQVLGDYTYEREACIQEEAVRASGIVQLGAASYKGDTLITASYRGVPMAMCNLELRGKGSDRSAVTFKGPFAVFWAARPALGSIWIFEKDSKTPASLQMGQLFTGVAEFDRQFTVYADSQATVNQVLDFRTMNAIMDAESKLPGHIRFSLVGGTVYMAVEDGSPLLSRALAKDQKEAGDVDELVSRAMFEICTLADIADALCFEE